MKRKLIFITLCLTLTLSLSLFAGCDNQSDSSGGINLPNSSDFSSSFDSSGEQNDEPIKYSEGLEFTLNDDGNSYSVTGVGTCTDSRVVIPKIYNEKPVTAIGEKAFQDCDCLKNVVIPDSVTSIGDYAFWECGSLKSITIPNGVTSIGEWLFYNCRSLMSVCISDSVTYIGKYAFYCCSALTSITIPSSVTSIDETVFRGCHKLVEVINKSELNNEELPILRLIVHDGESKIVNKNGYLFFTYNDTNYLLGYVGDETSLVLPSNYNGQNYEIYDYAFYWCNDLKNVTIGNGVTAIGECAFALCRGLKSVTISNGVVSICGGAFSDCFGLTSVTIPNSITSIGETAFRGCIKLVEIINKSNLENDKIQANINTPYLTIHNDESKIVNKDGYLFFTYDDTNYLLGYVGNETSLVLPNNYNGKNYEIYDYAFYWCTDIKSVTISNNITIIPYNTFDGCSSLKSVTIPNSVSDIKRLAFQDCSSLASVIIPSSVTSIDSCTFYNCSSLASVIIPNSVTSIGSQAFEGCKSLKSVTIPDSVTSIGSQAFEGCKSLKSVTISDSVTSIGNNAFDNCDNLQYNEYDNALYLGNESNPYVALIKAKNNLIISCVINNKTKVIADSSFSGCKSLTGITIPDGVTSIGDRAFSGCSALTSIIIPDSVTSICYNTFAYCNNLQYNEYDNALYLGNKDNPYYVLIIAKDNSITSCVVNDKTKVIVGGAFADCGGLKNITIPNNITYIGMGAFSSCKKLQYNEYDNGLYLGNESNPYVALIKYKDSSIASCIINDRTKIITSRAFYGCSGLTSITIPNSVTAIGLKAFEYCENLSEINFSGTVAEWNAIEKGDNWNSRVKKVYCVDGEATL